MMKTQEMPQVFTEGSDSGQYEESKAVHKKVPLPKWGLRAVLACIAMTGLAVVQSANARSLDGELSFLLADGCTELANASGGQLSVGNDLSTVCGLGGSGSGGSSAGGGAGSPQAAPSIVQERLLEARGETDDNSTTGTTAVLNSGFSTFFSGDYESLDRDITEFEDGYDSNIFRLTAGADYQFSTAFLFGLAVTYSKHDGDFTGGGDFDNDSYGLTAFASFIPLQQYFIQATASYAAKGYDRTRIASFDVNGNVVSGPAKGDYDGNEFSAGIMTGYDFIAGNMTIGPRLALDVINTDYDSYSETGTTGLELIFAEADQTSLQSRLGFAGSMAVSTSFGVVIPQFSANWVHEYENDQRTESFSLVQDNNMSSFQYQDEEPDRDFFEYSIGIAATLPNGWMPFAQFSSIIGHEYLDSYVGTVGLRIEF